MAPQVLPNNVIEVGAKAKVLDLKNNDLKVLPDNLSSLTQLHRIILSSNRLASLGPVVQLHNLKVDLPLQWHNTVFALWRINLAALAIIRCQSWFDLLLSCRESISNHIK